MLNITPKVVIEGARTSLLHAHCLPAKTHTNYMGVTPSVRSEPLDALQLVEGQYRRRE